MIYCEENKKIKMFTWKYQLVKFKHIHKNVPRVIN